MTTADLSTHRSAMATMHIAYITMPAERRMQNQSAEMQLQHAMAEHDTNPSSADAPVMAYKNKLELCKFLVGV